MSGPNAHLMVPGLRRNMVTICAMTATIMQALDTTIANVALPHMPCSRRNATICAMVCDSAQSSDAKVKPAAQMMKMRLRPKRLAIQPTGAVMIAAATM